MPHYEVECPMCGMRVEINQSFDSPLPECKKCGGKTIRLISTCNFSVGWRLTDRAHIKGNPPNEIERDI